MDSELAQALQEARVTLTGALDDRSDSATGSAAIARALRALSRAEAALGREQRPERDPTYRIEVLERRVDELTRAVALHDEFLSTLGHELRNPLSPIFMQAQYLLDTARGGDPRAMQGEWLVTQLEGFCRRLQKFLVMLNRVMDVSRISAGRLTLELEDIDMAGLVREVAGNFERELGVARSTLAIDAPPELAGVWDRLRVEQIFTNLLSNAIRYGASKPIEVSLSGDAEQVRLTVRDHGIGIREADQERIFQRFERAGQTRSSGGFGIGLWTVRQSCIAMGGDVRVQSRPGDGAEFTVTLPRFVQTTGGEKAGSRG